MQEELHQFLIEVNEIHGLFLDATSAFGNWYHQLLANQKHFQQQSGKVEKEFDDMKYIYGKEQKDGRIKPLGHSTTLGKLKERNKTEGNNHKQMARFSIVLIFSYWEYFRNKLVKRTKKTVASDLMADIMYLRRAIIHNRGIGDDDMKKCKVITRYKEGDNIEIDEDYFEEIIDSVKEEVKNIDKKYFT
ncbi:hypothetical protein KJ742_02855 [Patescibacteria group bacterium]|nr:hypothetical protein [Patescibacteria group bacterium]MBU1682860.1 hypothetical protein [Patescibacteria group bacterium]MBU1934726.1 hypothetical protein [Patescibacteria group bacterium]